jgi:hypothetical protein
MNTPGKVFSWLVSLYSFVVLGILLFLSYTEGKRYQMGIIASFLMLLIVFPPFGLSLIENIMSEFTG